MRVLRLLTYNVEYSRSREALTLDAIAEADADLVLLQEVTPGWEASLRARFAPAYPLVVFHAARGAGGLAVLSRAPLRDDRSVPGGGASASCPPSIASPAST